ncbi:MAG: ribose-phosphate diphosphokinase [Candidatus Riflebacteria bacterium]|nr:ribose-phosphate diphosphokinase [Candidatus Riflebacteria bacterium]
MKIFAGSSSTDFVKKMCNYLQIEPGQCETFHFSEGNTFVRIKENVRSKDVFIVQTIGLNSNDQFMELIFWIDAFKRASANSITVVMPFFSYSKADKKDEPRVSIRARVCADCLEVAGADRILTMDLHSPQIQGFFKKPVDHLAARPLLCEYILSRNLKNFVVASPDAGFTKSARKFAAYLKVPTVIGDKARFDHSENASILEIIGDVRGKNAVIVDDFTLTCGTLAETALALKKNGAEKIYAVVSHSLLSEKSLKTLEESCIEELFITDTVNNPLVKGHRKIRVISVAPLFAEAVKTICQRESLSRIFESVPPEVLKASTI